MKKPVRIAAKVVLLAFAFICIAYGILGIRSDLWPLLAFGVLLAAVTLLWDRFRRQPERDQPTRAWRLTRGIIAAVLGVALVVAVGMTIVGAIAAAPSNDLEGRTVIVLGTDVDGDAPGPLLEQRLKIAAGFLTEHPDAPVIVTGKGTSEHTEADVMAAYLVDQGIDSSRIIIEDQAMSTAQNFAYSRALIDEQGLSDRILVVTNDYHQLRSAIYARTVGLDPHALSAPATWYMAMPVTVREHIIIIEEWLSGSINADRIARP